MRERNDTCELKIVRQYPGRFTWGEPVKFHDLGRYTILEYHPWKISGCSVLTGQPDINTREFKPYVDGKELRSSWNTLEAAVIHAFAFAADNDNSGDAVRYVLRVLNFKSQDYGQIH